MKRVFVRYLWNFDYSCWFNSSLSWLGSKLINIGLNNHKTRRIYENWWFVAKGLIFEILGSLAIELTFGSPWRAFIWNPKIWMSTRHGDNKARLASFTGTRYFFPFNLLCIYPFLIILPVNCMDFLVVFFQAWHLRINPRHQLPPKAKGRHPKLHQLQDRTMSTILQCGTSGQVSGTMPPEVLAWQAVPNLRWREI